MFGTQAESELSPIEAARRRVARKYGHKIVDFIGWEDGWFIYKVFPHNSVREAFNVSVKRAGRRWEFRGDSSASGKI